jgi:DNA-3-methyladenine glycosylase I
VTGRCSWCLGDAQYIAYHDTEWGRPTADDRYLFEKLCLEGFQAGLSWLTILRKRENFRRAFAGFDRERVARFGPRQVERLLGDAAIVRHRGKLEAAIGNARAACEVAEAEGSLGALIWRFEPRPARRGAGFSLRQLRAATTSPESKALSKELRRRGFAFVGPTTMQALMQACGLVNHHVDGCQVRAAVERARAAFRRPSGHGSAPLSTST